MTPPEIIPAETIQADEADQKPVISLRFAIVLALIVAGVIAHHSVWSAGL